MAHCRFNATPRESKLEAVNAKLRECDQKQKHLEQHRLEKEQEIDAQFEWMKNLMNQRQSALKAKLNEFVRVQSDALKSLSEALSNSRDEMVCEMNSKGNVNDDLHEHLTGLKAKWRPIECVVDQHAISKVRSVS